MVTDNDLQSLLVAKQAFQLPKSTKGSLKSHFSVTLWIYE